MKILFNFGEKRRIYCGRQALGFLPLMLRGQWYWSVTFVKHSFHFYRAGRYHHAAISLHTMLSSYPQHHGWRCLKCAHGKAWVLPSSRLWKPSIRLGFVLGFIFILYTNTPFGGQECDTCRVPSECHPLAMQLRHLLMSGVVFCVPTTQYMQPCQAFEHERCDWCWRPSKNVQSFSNGLINPKMKSRVPAVIPLIIHWRS